MTESETPVIKSKDGPEHNDQVWAKEVRDAARYLVNIYAQAGEGVLLLKKPWQFVTIGGIYSIKNMFVMKPLLREAVLRHIRTNLDAVTPLALRAYRVRHLLPKVTSMGLNMKVATPDAIAKAEAERDARLKEKAVIGSLLDEALDDIASLNAILSRQPLFAARLFRVALNLVRRIAPLALAGWVIAQFKHLRGRPTWQELGFAILVLIAYHLIAWISLPFFNAAYRKFLYLNGYGFMGKPTDGLSPLEPSAKRLEGEFFKLLGQFPPIVVSWDEVIPGLHYVAVIAFVISLAFGLPLDKVVREWVLIFGGLLVYTYVMLLREWWRWIKGRYRDTSFLEIAWALVTTIDWETVLDPSKQKVHDAVTVD